MLPTKPLLFALLLGTTLLSGCANAAHLSATDPRISTASNNQPVAFQAVRLEGQSVKGQIRLTGVQPVQGHVDYTVLDASGKPREQGTVEHTAATKLRHSNRPALFSINLQRPLAAGESVQLRYHTGLHPESAAVR